MSGAGASGSIGIEAAPTAMTAGGASELQRIVNVEEDPLARTQPAAQSATRSVRPA